METGKTAERIRQLNETYYALYGRLYENSEQLTKEQRDSMAAKLLAAYEADCEILRLQEEIVRANALYELKLKGEALIPRTWRQWFRRKYNRAAEITGAEVDVEVERVFAPREAALEAAYAAENGGDEPEKGTAERGKDAAQEASADSNAGGPERVTKEPKGTAERGRDAVQEAGEADLSEKPVGAKAATDGGGGERFTAAPTADGDDAPTGDAGLPNGSTASI